VSTSPLEAKFAEVGEQDTVTVGVPAVTVTGTAKEVEAWSLPSPSKTATIESVPTARELVVPLTLAPEPVAGEVSVCTYGPSVDACSNWGLLKMTFPPFETVELAVSHRKTTCEISAGITNVTEILPLVPGFMVTPAIPSEMAVLKTAHSGVPLVTLVASIYPDSV
jgi:hypothetical protein